MVFAPKGKVLLVDEPTFTGIPELIAAEERWRDIDR
jgi:hypothetical protein